MLMGCTIENMVLGGPAYNSYKLDKGDIILKVDGEPVDEDSLLPALIGSDVPGEEMALVTLTKKNINDSDHICMHAGTSVSLTVRKRSGTKGGNPDVVKVITLQRMKTEEIADKRRMFELFAHIKDQAVKEGDAHLGEVTDMCINLWTKMLISDAEHDNKVDTNVRQMQAECDK